MAWYVTGTIAVSGTTVTGTGTNFLDNTQSIGPGQALLIPGSGTVKMYEIASVQSATKLTLKTSAGTVAAGQAYAILSFYTDSVPDFARRLAAQLSYYQSQMDGWQQIMTGTGSITMTAPDGTTVTISSFAKLTADVAAVANGLQIRGQLPTTGIDFNNLGPTAENIGIWYVSSSAQLSSLLNMPENNLGQLEVTAAGRFQGMQRYTTYLGAIYIRCLNAAWSASSPNWTAWCLVGDQPVQGYVAGDLNNYITPGTYSVPTGVTNMPLNYAGIMEVKLRLSTNSLVQRYTIIGTSASLAGKTWTRVLSGTTWSAWVESLTTNSFGTVAGTAAQGNDSRLNTINGKTGGTISSEVIINGGGLKVSGTSAGTSNTASMSWVGGSGAMDLVDNRGSGAGGILLRIVNSDNSANIALFNLQSSGVGLAPGGWQTGSDERIKEDIRDIDPEFALNAVINMRHVTFKMRDRPDGEGGWVAGERSAGYLAQDLERYLPEAVSTANSPKTFDDDGNQTGFPYQCKANDGSIIEIEDMKSVDPGKASAALNGAAIKALNKKIKDLEEVISMIQKGNV